MPRRSALEATASLTLRALLIANRGEIAIRVSRAAVERGLRSVAVYSEDDANSLHTRRADEARALKGVGVAPYLDIDQILAAAKDAGCDAIHPGYGFLSENAEFARRCAGAGVTFIGPRTEILELLGDKVKARAFAQRCGIPIIAGTASAADVAAIKKFFASLGDDAAIMIKAVGGGGGRGMRIVRRLDEIDEAYVRCESEARAAFGNGALYAERLMPRARHIEVQIVGDGMGAVSHLYERECSLQRRNQKLIEIAPSPSLDAGLRERLLAAAIRMARELRYNSLGTFEFLVDAGAGDAGEFAFIEANPRLQVEHTVTEAVTGIDLVKLQLGIAQGAGLADLGATQDEISAPRGFAIQARINLETIGADGTAKPAGGTITVFEPPSGPGIRVDSFGYSGYTTSPRFDSLLAKLVVHSTSSEYRDVVRKTSRALGEFRIEGVASNLGFLQNLIGHPDFAANRVYTRFIEEHLEQLTEARDHERRYFDNRPPPRIAGVKLNSADPLAVLAYGKGEDGVSTAASSAPPLTINSGASLSGPENTIAISAPIHGTIATIAIAEGDEVHQGQQLLIMEAMKMEHEIRASVSGIVRRIAAAAGDAIREGQPLVFIEEAEVARAASADAAAVDLERIRPDLAEVNARHAIGLDEARPDAVERRRKTGQRTARENIAELCDPGSFVEYGALAVAAQRRRRSLDDLIKRTPADGMIAGLGRVNGDQFDDAHSRCIAISYDYTVLAGTQGQQNHRKKDRMFELAERLRLPVVFFTEGGGGRPGDTDGIAATGLECLAFHYWGGLSGLVPLIGINSGRCFAGNAAILGCCDVVIATRNSNIGMGGPAMIEGGGLGVYRPEEVGPMEVQVPNGVVDLAVADEGEAVRVARQYLSYFQGATQDWKTADQRLLRSAIPENRLRIYDIRALIETLADSGSVLEIRRHFGLGMVTALIRIEGRPLGLIANNPAHLAGAIDSDAADKAARFMQLCDAFDLPLLFLCDTPGIMVGPEVEKTALVRHASRMFVTGASITVPFFTIILRKGYGLGAQAMAGASFKSPLFTVAWPTGEFGGMGLEGAVKLAYRNDLAAVEEPEKRKVLYEQMVQRMYDHGKAVSVASTFELDDVIDPADSRRWIMAGLRSSPPPPPRTGKKRPCIDTW
ncbi:MAG TPA: carboxyl transferase domain-containing protein [Candidatus Binataceae bacterium]|nr:carboxyl transferase domain-containing protein [Candidatus Binataceae bacterium]